MIRLYGMSTCPWCRRAKQLLDHRAARYELIEVDLIDGEKLRKALAEVDELCGKRAFPVLVIGKTVVQGFKPEEIERALDREAKDPV
ncbi:MAG TPA: glutaredoxin family protein [Clostridiales bacterium UBA8153]|nr:glutaredoxin family protein [Clostridiales bacterium UBA8153]